MTKRAGHECRYQTERSSSGFCRRLHGHKCHQPHDDDCRVPLEQHHAFVAPQPYGRFQGVMKRKSIWLSESDGDYCKARGHGNESEYIRQLIARDRGAASPPIRITSIEAVTKDPVAPEEEELIV